MLGIRAAGTRLLTCHTTHAIRAPNTMTIVAARVLPDTDLTRYQMNVSLHSIGSSNLEIHTNLSGIVAVLADITRRRTMTGSRRGAWRDTRA